MFIMANVQVTKSRSSYDNEDYADYLKNLFNQPINVNTIAIDPKILILVKYFAENGESHNYSSFEKYDFADPYNKKEGEKQYVLTKETTLTPEESQKYKESFQRGRGGRSQNRN